MVHFFKKYKWAFLSGVLMGTSYIPFPPWALLFCFAPLFYWVSSEGRSFKEVFIAGWITQFVLTIIGFYWVAYVVYEFGELPWVVSFLALFLFSSFIHLYIPLSLILTEWIAKRVRLSFVQKIFLLPCVYFLFECFWPSLFSWNLGYPWLWAKLPIFQLADVIGFEGLSLLSLLTSGLVAFIFYVHKSDFKLKALKLLIVVFVFIGLNILGAFHKPVLSADLPKLNVLVVQGNIGNQDRIQAEKGRGKQTEIVYRFLNQTQEALLQFPNTDLIFWPESAFPDALNEPWHEMKRQKLLFHFLTEQNKNLLTGAYSQNEAPSKKNPLNDPYNAMFLVGPQGLLDVPYHKSQLLAYGEYYPLTETFPILRTWFPVLSNFGRGDGPTVLTYKNIKLGPQICYESLDPFFSQGLAEKGAQIIFNVTNDSWFGEHFEPYQHLYMTLARAVETRLPLVRSTNTGISTAILANGDVLQKSPIYKKWSGLLEVIYSENPQKTFYVRWGIYFPFVLLITIIILLGIQYAKSTKGS